MDYIYSLHSKKYVCVCLRTPNITMCCVVLYWVVLYCAASYCFTSRCVCACRLKVIIHTVICNLILCNVEICMIANVNVDMPEQKKHILHTDFLDNSRHSRTTVFM